MATKLSKNAQLNIGNSGTFTNGFYNPDRGYWISFENARVASNAQNLVYFHGFITAFKDMFKPEWNEETVFGRTEPIGIYKGISRRISFSFDAPANNTVEGELNLNKVEGLVEMLYPSYHTVQGDYKVLSQSPLVRIKFANLISNGQQALLGYITSFDYDLNLGKDVGVFDHVSGKIYPRVINFNIDFTVLNEKMLGYDDVSDTFEQASGWLYGGSPVQTQNNDVQFGSKIDGADGDRRDEIPPVAMATQDEKAGEASPGKSLPGNATTDSVDQSDADAINAAVGDLSDDRTRRQKRLDKKASKVAKRINNQEEKNRNQRFPNIFEPQTSPGDLIREGRQERLDSLNRRRSRAAERQDTSDNLTFRQHMRSDEVKGRN